VREYPNLVQNFKAFLSPSKLIYDPSKQNIAKFVSLPEFLIIAIVALESYTKVLILELKSTDRTFLPLEP